MTPDRTPCSQAPNIPMMTLRTMQNTEM